MIELKYMNKSPKKRSDGIPSVYEGVSDKEVMEEISKIVIFFYFNLFIRGN